MATNTIIIGAGMAGLASAVSLKKQGIEYLIIEKQQQVAVPWRNHYDRLHLHTSKQYSHLPYKKFRKEIPRYPSRQQVVDYLDEYQREFQIAPLFGTEAVHVQKQGIDWMVHTSAGLFQSRYLIMASGVYGRPVLFSVEGMYSFTGQIIHSSLYKSGSDYTGKKVLVIGFGNSACEIAMDLYEQGAIPLMSVRSPVNVLPREIFGVPVQELSLLLRPLPPRVADLISAPLIRASLGDLKLPGLKKMSYGPLEQIHRDGKAPVLDIGTIQHIRKGNIRVHGAIEKMEGDTIFFKDGLKEKVDAVIACTGYERNSCDFLQVEKSRLDDLRVSINKQRLFGKDGLYFCGYWVSATGQIREISLDAIKIAGDIAKKQKTPAKIS